MSLTSAEIVAKCSGAGDGSDGAYLQCLTDQLLVQDAQDRQFSRTIYLIYSAALVFFMQAGELPRDLLAPHVSSTHVGISLILTNIFVVL